jgi:DNA modification methylase
MRKYIKDNTIDLCYIDPPFNSKRNYNQIYNNIGNEDKAQAQAFIDTWTWDNEAIKGFGLIQENYNGLFTKQSIELLTGLEKVLGKGSLLAYLVSMTLRIVEIFRVLTPTGSFYLHCDPTASHYIKLIIDAIFCPNGGDFRNEIVWCYSIGGRSSETFGEKHDVILFYSKGKKWTFNGDDEHVRIDRKPNSHMKVITGPNGDTLQVKTDKKTGKEYVYPLDKIANDYWIDIEQLNREDAERLGYPTQKPEELLERIIGASSNEGDTVLDAYCGCGTTVIVAEREKRNWIGIDITYQSISLILKRLEDTFDKQVLANIELNGIPEDMKSAIALANKKEDKTRKEFEKWAVLTYSNNRAIINEKKGSDTGIDGIAYMMDKNDKGETELKKVLFSVKSDKTPHVSYIRDFYGTIEREKAAMGYFITLYPATKDMKAECKKLELYKNALMETEYPKIDIVTVEEILSGKRIPIPTSHQIDVLKSAKPKESRKKQGKLL